MLRSLSVALVILLSCAFLAPAVFAEDDAVDLGIITVKNKDLADSIRQRLVKGETFESLAKEYSVGPASFRGGRLGMVPNKRLRTEYKQALKGLKTGQPSKVVLTEEGYSILQLFGPKEEPAVSFKPGAPAAPAAKQESPQLASRRMVLAGLESLVAGNSKEAEAEFSKAVGLNPAEDSATFMLDITRQANRGKINAKTMRLFGEGMLAMVNGNTNVAMENFKRSYQISPDFWQGMLFEANMLAGLGNRKGARELLNKVLTLNPKSSRANLTLGIMDMEEKKDMQAMAYFKRAVTLNPYLADAHYQLGTMAMIGRDLPEAERQFKATLALDPYMEEAYNDLGLVYFYTNRKSEAVKMYKKAMELNPEYPSPHVNLGNLYAMSKEYNRAIDEYNKALSIIPTLGEAHVNLAAAYVLQKNWPMAIQHADKALSLGMRVPDSILRAVAPHRK